MSFDSTIVLPFSPTKRQIGETIVKQQSNNGLNTSSISGIDNLTDFTKQKIPTDNNKITDPMLWRSDDVKAWVTFTLRHYNLQVVPEEYFAMDGPALAALTEEEFIQRAPQV